MTHVEKYKSGMASLRQTEELLNAERVKIRSEILEMLPKHDGDVDELGDKILEHYNTNISENIIKKKMIDNIEYILHDERSFYDVAKKKDDYERKARESANKPEEEKPVSNGNNTPFLKPAKTIQSILQGLK